MGERKAQLFFENQDIIKTGRDLSHQDFSTKPKTLLFLQFTFSPCSFYFPLSSVVVERK